MSLYGYDQGISQGEMMNARNLQFNQGVKQHNKLVNDNYDAALKTQTKTIGDLQTKKKEDAAIHDSSDGYGLVGAGVSFLGARKEYQQAANFSDYVSNVTEQRTTTLRAGLDNIKLGKEGRAKAGAATGDSGGNLDNELPSAANEPPAIADRPALQIADRPGAPTTPTESGLPRSREPPPTGVGQVEGGVEGLESGGAFKHESSGIGARIIKTGLTKIGVADRIGEGATGAIAEGAGKVAGAIAGTTDLVEGIDNLVDGKGFFAQDGDNTAKKVGDSFTMAGTVLDAVGTFVPPLEVAGAVVSLTGGIIDTVSDWFGDNKKLKDAGKPIPPPSLKNGQLEGQKVSPAFQSLGLVASGPTSVKSKIQGASSF